jgi:hypothetical protein
MRECVDVILFFCNYATRPLCCYRRGVDLYDSSNTNGILLVPPTGSAKHSFCTFTTYIGNGQSLVQPVFPWSSCRSRA